tara:strand:- start:365 stop:691 length:327 start_codon:yes stop_codon:yes gene_type:complete
MAKSVDEQIRDAISNLEDDRAIAFDHVIDLWQIIKGEGSDGHKKHGPVQAKYFEALQRSNEQLVKLISVLAKQQSGLFDDLSEREKDELMDYVQDEENNSHGRRNEDV